MNKAKHEKPAVIHSHGFMHRPFPLPDFSSGIAADTAPRQGDEKPEAEPAPAQPEEPEVMRFSEEEMQAACKEAEEMGRQKGLAEAKQAQDAEQAAQNAQIAALLDSLNARMGEEVAAYENLRESLRSEMAGIVLLVARKLAGNALDTQPLGAVEGMINDCLTMMAGETRLAITVAEPLKAPLEQHLATLHTNGPVLEVRGSAAMQPGDCRIEWPGGKAERNQEKLREEMEAIIKRALTGKQ